MQEKQKGLLLLMGNPSEGAALMSYINQYRADNGVGVLNWNYDLEQVAQSEVEFFSVNGYVFQNEEYELIGRQCNGAKNAQKAVDDWIYGNAYIPSESESLLNEYYTQIGGALYYLPNGNEHGYHYFWVVCLK